MAALLLATSRLARDLLPHLLLGCGMSDQEIISLSPGLDRRGHPARLRPPACPCVARLVPVLHGHLPALQGAATLSPVDRDPADIGIVRADCDKFLPYCLGPPAQRCRDIVVQLGEGLDR